MIRRIAHIVLIGCLLTSCVRPIKEKNDFLEWAKENDALVQKSTSQDFELEATYRPAELIVASEYSSEVLSKAILEKRKNELSDLVHFNLKISHPDQDKALLGSSQEEYFSKLEYYLTSATNDIWLETKSDTLKPSIYHFERYFNLTNYHLIALAFEVKDKEQLDRFTLCFDGNASALGYHEFKFNSINNIPELRADEL